MKVSKLLLHSFDPHLGVVARWFLIPTKLGLLVWVQDLFQRLLDVYLFINFAGSASVPVPMLSRTGPRILK